MYAYYAYDDIQSICPFYAYSGANLIGYPQTHHTYRLSPTKGTDSLVIHFSMNKLNLPGRERKTPPFLPTMRP